MILISILVSSNFIYVSCHNKKIQLYGKNGIQLYYPGTWKIENELSNDSTRSLVVLQEKGISPTGIFTITKFMDSLDRSKTLNIYKIELQKNTLFDKNSLAFGSETSGSILNKESITIDYSLSLRGLRCKGDIHVLYANQSTIVILKQSTLINRQKNDDAFQMIEQSLNFF